MKEQTKKLRPWISFDPKLKGLPNHIIYETIQNIQKPCSLISLISIQPQQMHLIDSFQLEVSTQTQLTPLVYISKVITFQGIFCRIIYIPPNKTENQSVQYLSDILRELSDIVISDINNSGLNRIRKKGPIKRFVVVNGKDLYRTEFGQGQLQLVKKVETPLLSTFKEEENQVTRDISLDYLIRSFEKCQKSWQLLMGGDKSWSQLSISTLQHFQAEYWLDKSCQKISEMRDNKKLLSKLELELIHQDLMSRQKFENSWQLSKARQLANQMIADVRRQNSQYIMTFLKQMQKTCAQFTSTEDLLKSKLNIVQHLSLFDISEEFADYIICEKQKELILTEKDELNSHIIHLNQIITEYEKKLSEKSNQISEFKKELEEYCNKFVHLFQIEQKFSEIVQELGHFKQKNDRLSSELDAHLFLQKKYIQDKQSLVEKIRSAEKQNKGMIQCLRELTQESLGLHNTIQKQREQIEELKKQLKENSDVQIRALRSIENEAEIKIRLQRYQNYVNDLKSNLKSYRRLQTQKFNYILSHNFKEYTKLKDQYSKLTHELQKSRELNQELSVSLQRQKTRMAYFEKFLRSNYNTEPIIECSEENSVTDRQAKQIIQE